MEISNYPQKLARYRSQFQNDIDDLKQNHKDEIKQQNETNQYRQKKIKDNFKKQKQSFEKDTLDNINEFNSRNSKNNKILQKRYKATLDDDRNKHRQEVLKKGRELDRKFNFLKKTYTKSLKENKRMSKDQMQNKERNINQKFATRLSEMQNDKQEIIKNTDKKIALARENYQKQKEESAKINETKLITNTHQRDSELKKTKEDFNNVISRLKKSFKDEKAHITLINKGHLKNASSKNGQQTDSISNNFKKQLHEIHLKESIEREKNDATYESAIQKLQREHIKQLENHRNEINTMKQRYDYDISGTSGKIESLKQSSARKINSLKGELTKQETRSQRKLKEQEHNLLLDQRLDARSFNLKQKQKEQKSYERNINVMKEASTDKAKMDKRNEIVLKKQSSDSIQQMVREQRRFKKIISNQKKDFGDTVNSLVQQNIDSISDLQKKFATNKTELTSFFKKQQNEESGSIRDNFKDIIEKRELSHNLQAKEQKKEKTNIEKRYKNKIKSQNEKMMAIEKNYLNIQEEQNKINKKTIKTMEKNLKKDFEAQKRNIITKYHREIQQLKDVNDLKITKQVKQHAKEKEQQIYNHSRELKTKVGQHRKQYERFVEESKLATENLISHYENKMHRLQSTFQKDIIKQSI